MKNRGKEIEVKEIENIEDMNLKEENTRIFEFYDVVKNYGLKPYKQTLTEINAIMGKVEKKKTRSGKIRKKKKEKLNS